MNRRKSKPSNLSLPTLLVLFVAGIIVTVGGIGYVMVKNKQVTLRHQINKTQQVIADHETAITMYQSDINQRLGFAELQQHFGSADSEFKVIPGGLPTIYRPSQEAPVERVAQSP